MCRDSMENGDDSLDEALIKRESLFRGMLAISRHQLEFCQREDLETADLAGFLELVSQRQALMDEIDHLNSLLASGGDAPPLPTAAGGVEPVTNAELIGVMEAIRRNDEACLQLLKGKSTELTARIKQTRVNRQAADAYSQGQGAYEPWFVDKKK